MPTALRAAGWSVVSMRERYGSVTAQQLADIDWIRDATREGEILLTGDKAIAKRPIEARTVVEAKAQVFALGSNQLTGADKAARFLDHAGRILARAAIDDGPFVVSVTARGLQTLKIFS